MNPEGHVSMAARACLEQGYRRLRLELGIVSRIRGDVYQIIAVYPDSGMLGLGTELPLEQTYCRDVFERGRALARNDLSGEWGLSRHPLYVMLSLEAYIGAPLRVRGATWGTINFTSHVRRRAFTDEDLAFVSALADRVGLEIERSLEF